MPRSGATYNIDDTWRQAVDRTLRERGWDRADLADAAGCSPSVITDLLNGKKNQSPYVPEIHSALGWTPPHSALLPQDQEEVLRIYQALDSSGRERMKGFGQGLIEQIKKLKKD